MQYQHDQSRGDSHQSHPHPPMHFHVHQCVCTNGLYNPYRQPMIAPYVPPPPVARPYNLAHYQYTSYNIPYNMPMFSPNAIAAHQAPPTNQIADNAQLDPNEDASLATSEDIDDYYQNTDANTEDFTRFLEKGCEVAEKISIRNQHRPCFKNIQNLCNRTRNEILKPSHTVSNIHSQGVPWATKDFIYAYVRLINCWHMLKGYLQARDGTLGNIDRELTGEFKNCYSIWEGNTRDLAEHMIRIFTNLDINVSNPQPQIFINRTRVLRATPSISQVEAAQNIEAPLAVTNDDGNQFSESTTEAEPSPREEESDIEGRIYMRPGSYNVPKRNDSTDNSQPTIEFFETAKNIATHYRKLEAKKQSEAAKKQTENAEKEWMSAIGATPVLIKRNAGDLEKRFDELKKQNVDVEQIRQWLCHEKFDQQNRAYPMSEMMRMPAVPERQVTLQQRAEQGGKDDAEGEFSGGVVKNGIFRNVPPNMAYMGKIERDQQATKILLDELEKTQLSQTLTAESAILPESFESLQTIVHKFNCKYYRSSTPLVHALRRMVSNVQSYYSNDPDVFQQASSFCSILDDALERLFPNVDFIDHNADMDELD